MAIFNRATYSRCASLIYEMEKDPDIKLDIVVGSALVDDVYGESIIYIESDHSNASFFKLEDNHAMHVFKSGDMVKQLHAHIVNIQVHAGYKYDAAIVIADRYETLPAAMAFAYNNIPLIHLQGGEVTGNLDERVRHSVTKLSDYHFTCTKLSRDYVLRMGEEPSRAFYTGCPSLDLIRKYHIRRSLPRKKYIISMFHPDTENLEECLENMEVVLKCTIEFCATYGTKAIVYAPNPDPGREDIAKLVDKAIEEQPDYLTKAVNLEPYEFLRQLAGCRFIVGNSSCGIREASFIGVPSINIGNRQSIRERSENVIDVEAERAQLLEAMQLQFETRKYKRSFLYGDSHGAENIMFHLKRLDFTQKGPLIYPYELQHRQAHFGDRRFNDHGTKKGQIRYRASKRGHLQS